MPLYRYFAPSLNVPRTMEMLHSPTHYRALIGAVAPNHTTRTRYSRYFRATGLSLANSNLVVYHIW
jgi:hypothetical protein